MVNFLPILKWLNGFCLAEEKDGYKAGGGGRGKGEKKQKPSLLFSSVKICIFLFPPETQSNHQHTDSTLKANSITNHLQSHAQNIKPNSVTGLVGQINEATENKVLLNRD